MASHDDIVPMPRTPERERDIWETPASPNTPLLGGGETSDHHAAVQASLRERDPTFYNIIVSVDTAIENGILPQRIVQGSSGSYFARNTDSEIVGIFKPKNEEPYGHLNPKWTKWMQKLCCPCMFGRSCLILNQGYLSEAGASIVDTNLGLGVVPKTRVVRLSSKSFYYSKFDRARSNAVTAAAEHFPDSIGKHVRPGLPPKVGSFQLFVKGYKDACVVLKRLDLDAMTPECRKSFQLQFESMVCLDYIIRNTDRGNDNWLLKYEKTESGEETIKLAAIDNGLAFPHKHPDNWRAYPYYWAWLPMAREPFSEEIARKILPQLDNDDFVEELVDQLFVLFSQDGGFDKSQFENQMGVLRGQIMNLRKALRERLSPVELVALRPAKLVIQRDRTQSTSSTSFRKRFKYKQVFSSRSPFFKWC
eukprot:m.59812 g.59812  ORF g.59812 m.59812 type:complete len:420 (+) comp7241_c0_seq1:109-1368(+)